MKIPKKQINIGGEMFEVPDLRVLLGGSIWVILIILLVLWSLLTGVYKVNAGHKGVVKTFGKYSRTTDPGLHIHLPYPIESHQVPYVEEIKRTEIGFRMIDPGPPARYADRPKESLMLTGGQNIIDCEMIVQYKIFDAKDYLFNVRDLPKTVHEASEASLRLVIGKNEIDAALTYGRGQIEADVKVQLQQILDLYESGLLVINVQLQTVLPPKEVESAFRDVQSAKEDRDRMINEAKGYYNDIIPRTRGQKAKMIKEAEAWAVERVAKAEGDAENFIQILNQYRKSKNVTRKRLLLETMEEILPGLTKYIIKSDGSGNLMNVLGLSAPDFSKTGRKK